MKNIFWNVRCLFNYVFNIQNTMYLDENNVYHKVSFKNYMFHENMIREWRNSSVTQGMLKDNGHYYLGEDMLLAGVITKSTIDNTMLYMEGYHEANKQNGVKKKEVHPERKYILGDDLPGGVPNFIFEDIK